MVTNQVQNRLGSKMVVGSFYWDADRDETKKISMKGDITPSNNGLDANIVLEMPSIGQVRLYFRVLCCLGWMNKFQY
jgi:hypothetical protein